MKGLKEQIYLMQYELNSAGSKVLRNKSAKLNQSSLYKEGEIVKCDFTFNKVKIHLILGQGASRGSIKGVTNYLIELTDSDMCSHWEMTSKEKKRYGCHPDKRYKIVLEHWLGKLKNETNEKRKKEEN